MLFSNDLKSCIEKLFIKTLIVFGIGSRYLTLNRSCSVRASTYFNRFWYFFETIGLNNYLWTKLLLYSYLTDHLEKCKIKIFSIFIFRQSSRWYIILYYHDVEWSNMIMFKLCPTNICFVTNGSPNARAKLFFLICLMMSYIIFKK